MTDKLEKVVESMAADIDSIFEDVKNDNLSSNTVKALSSCYDAILELGMDNKTLEKDSGLIYVSEEGIQFWFHEADEMFFFSINNKSISKILWKP